MTETEKMLKQIQYKTGDTIATIASKIGYSRAYLSSIKSKEDNQAVLALLREKYNTVLDLDPSERFENIKQTYLTQGHTPTIPILSTDQGNVLLMSINAASYAAIEMLCRVVANQENIPIETVRKQANQLTHERQRLVEQVLDKLVSVVPSDNTKKTDSN